MEFLAANMGIKSHKWGSILVSQDTNFSAQVFDLSGLEVLGDEPNNAVLGSYRNAALSQLLKNPGAAAGQPLSLGADGNSILGSKGLPYVFDTFKLQGIIDEPQKVVEKGEAWHATPGVKASQHRLEIPVNDAVVTFS